MYNKEYMVHFVCKKVNFYYLRTFFCERQLYFFGATVWKMMPTCIFWTIWRERNNMSFEDFERSLEDIISSFFFFFLIKILFPLYSILCTFELWPLCPF
jgi:hypothetical protein